MKKFFHITLAALALLTLSAACSKVNPVDETPASKTITIKATISDAATRVTFDPAFDGSSNPTAMAHTWQAGDKLRITDASDATKTVLFDLVDGAGTATGTFEGEGFEATSYNVEAVPQGSFSSGYTQTQAKDGATDHLQFVATATGVTDLSSFTLAETSGIVGVIAKLPKDVAGTITALEIEAKVAVLPMPIKVTVNLTAQEDVDSDDILKIYANAPTGFAIPAGAEVFLRFKSNNPDHTVYTRYQKFDSNLLPVPGKFNFVKFNCKDIDKFAGAGNDGSSPDPYLIADKYQLLAMSELVAAGSTKSFKMVDDVDLDGEDWIPFNYASPYDKAVDFDGDGHKILNLKSDYSAYPSFAGVVAGDIQNVTFVNPVIKGGTQHAGVVGGYIGTGEIIGNCTGVIVENATVTGGGESSKGKNIGGFGGYVGAAGTIKDCHVKGTTTVKQTLTATGSSAGGFIGSVGAAASIEGCTAKADVSNAASYYTAGFVGQIGAAVAAVIKDCAFLGGNIHSERSNNNSPVGGFIGRITKDAHASIEKCYVDGAIIDAAPCGRTGGFVGEASNNNTLTSCYVKNTTVSGGMNTGGFVGVLYCAASKCYVDKTTTVNANNIQNGGFAAYPENARITNCYSSATVNGAGQASVGGFIGIFKKNNTVEYCYENGTVSGTAESVGAFIGQLDQTPISLTKCIAWDASLPFYGAKTDGVDESTIMDNYTGNSGSIYGQAVALGGWDFVNTWTTDPTPLLK